MVHIESKIPNANRGTRQTPLQLVCAVHCLVRLVGIFRDVCLVGCALVSIVKPYELSGDHWYLECAEVHDAGNALRGGSM